MHIAVKRPNYLIRPYGSFVVVVVVVFSLLKPGARLIVKEAQTP